MEAAISRHFSADEISRLEYGLARPSAWSDALLVPFSAYRLHSASLAWINRRWLLERKFDITQSSTLQQVTAWLIDEFAWCVGANGNHSAPDTRILWADRYGTSDGVGPHGGSGRVATIGCFQAKGIGPTPLVGPGAPPGHSHGCLSLAEGLREAVWGEIAAAEFPHGAVPVVAVLDTGMYFSSPNPGDQYDQCARRGILIRAAVMRPAHAERAPLFKRSINNFVSKQSDDVRRTREVIVRWTGLASQCNGGTKEVEVLEALVRRIGEQIAFGQVHRLFSGGYFSSNVSIDGELLDFGNMHALPNWARAQVHSVVAGLGAEMALLRPVIGSLAFFFWKYGRGSDFGELGAAVAAAAECAYVRAWRRYGLSLFQAGALESRSQDAVIGILHGYFKTQQRQCVKYRFGLCTSEGITYEATWLYDALIQEQSAFSLEQRTLGAIVDVLTSSSGSSLFLTLGTAARLLKPRRSVERRHLLSALADSLLQSGEPSGLDKQRIARLLRESISGARRHWRRLPCGYVVLAHTVHDGCSALLCARERGDRRTIWLEGIGSPCSKLHCFERRLEESDFLGGVHWEGVYWWTMCPAEQAAGGAWRARLRNGEIALPPFDITYAQPASKWMEVKRA